MSINSITPQSEVVIRNKQLSDIRESLTDSLTIESSRTHSSHGKAAREVRRRKDDLSIIKLERQDVCGASYYDDLEAL